MSFFVFWKVWRKTNVLKINMFEKVHLSMKDWEWGFMKEKRKDKPLVALNETVVFEKSSYIYIFSINCLITILV